MGGLSAGSDAFFSVSPAELAKPECFAVKRGDMVGRVDPKHYALRESLSSPYPLARLGALVRTEPDYGLSARAVARKSADEPRYIRITDFGEDGIEPGHIFVTPEAVESGYDLAAGDILFARTGSVGKTYIHEDTSEPAIFAGYCIRFQFDATRALPGFVYWWTKTAAYARWVAAIRRPSVQANINKEEFKSCLIPLPPAARQGELAAAMAAARAERRDKLAAADQLLAGLDDFVLGELGLNPNPPQRATAAIRVANLRNSRYDPDFHSLRFKTIREGIASGAYPTASIAELCEQIATGFAAGRGNQAFDYESGLPHLRPLNLDTFGQLSLAGTKFVPKEAAHDDNLCQRGEVLFNNTNSTSMVGKSVVFELEQPCACSNHITRLRTRNGVSPHYLAAVFNSLRRLGYLGLLSTNFNNQAGINRETLSQLRIPHPPLPEQERIAAEVIRRREESRRLRSEAEAGWQAAKAWFEGEVLGK